MWQGALCAWSVAAAHASDIRARLCVGDCCIACLKGNLVRVIEVEVNLGVNRLTKISPTAERLFEGRATMIIDGSRHRFRIALPRPAAKRASLNTRCGCKTVMTSVKWTAAGSNPAGSWC